MTTARRESAELAGHVHRLAVLIAAGLAPRTAWAHVAAVAQIPIISSLAAHIDRGSDVGDAIESVVASSEYALSADDESAWRSLAAAWRVATVSGSPLAPALRGFAETLRNREAAHRDIRIALAGPRATARIVMLLPVVAVLLGLLMGVDLVATISTPVGAGAVAAGLVLIMMARGWMRRLVRSAAPPAPSVGLALDLLAVAAGGGGSPEAAAALVVAEVRRALPAPHLGADDALSRDTAHLDALVQLSRAAGAPLGELARAEAAETRNRARAESRESAERLAVRLMLPLGACILPSFLLVGVVPMLLGLLSSTAGAW